MRMKSFLPAVAAAFVSGCASGPTDFSTGYREALASRPGAVLSGTALEVAVGRFAGLYGDLSVGNVAANVREVYAADAWFNDTIATEVGIASIEKYLLRTAEGAEAVHARINDVAVSGSDCYVRWTMEVRTKNLAGGRPIVTEGVSQLRFDADGRIILHQDFWNPAAGIYGHLPLLGPAIRFVNRLVAPE